MSETIEVGSIRLRRLVRDGGTDRVTVEVEIDGEWVEVIREVYDPYFDHFVSPSEMRGARAKNGGETRCPKCDGTHSDPGCRPPGPSKPPNAARG